MNEQSFSKVFITTQEIMYLALIVGVPAAFLLGTSKDGMSPVYLLIPLFMLLPHIGMIAWGLTQGFVSVRSDINLCVNP